MKEHRPLFALLLLGLTVAPGCASWTPFGWFKKDREANFDRDSDLSQLSSPKGNSKQPVRSAVKSATSAVAGALAIKPKVVPADDPTALNYKGNVDAEVYAGVARLYAERGSYDEALKQYDRALKIAPNDPPTLVGVARVYDQMGNLPAAENFYRRAISAAPNSPLAASDLGLFYARQRRFPDAIGMLDRAVRIDPQRPLYRNNLASALVDTQQPDRALQHLLAVHPPAVAHYNLGYMLHDRGLTEPAMFHFTRAALLNPAMPEAQAMIAQMTARDDNRSASRMPEPTRNASAPPWRPGSTYPPPAEAEGQQHPPDSRPWQR